MNTEPATERPLTVAVVGAGISALTCAQVLDSRGHRVRVFERARGPGGRAATRRSSEWQFDHGAQYFTVRDPKLASWVEAWRRAGIVAPWSARVAVLEGGTARFEADETERFVGVPGMNAVGKHLATGLDVALETQIVDIARVGDGWRLVTEGGVTTHRHDALVLSPPAPQTASLLDRVAPALAARAAGVEMAPCWAVLAGFRGPLGLDFDAAFVNDSPLRWVARDAAKPERPPAEAWVLHASAEWSRENLELAGEEVAETLVAAFQKAVGGLDSVPLFIDAHRWRAALPVNPLPEACLFESALGLAACGDWCGGPRFEGAFLSGLAAAARILDACSEGRGR